MTVRVYRSTDTNAPQLSGTAGSLVAVLDACLIDGYAMPTITSITRSGSTATIEFSAAHGLLDINRLTISGATETAYNGEFEVNVTDTTHVTYSVSGSPATPATGSPSAAKTASGWSKSFSGTNKAVYQSATGNTIKLRVDDTGTVNARVVGYESMTDVDTGTNAFPTSTQQTGGLYWIKASNTTGNRPWIIVASQKGFHLHIDQANSNTSSHWWWFGDITTDVAADAYHTLIIGSNTTGGSSGVVMTGLVSILTNALSGHYLPRSYTQSGTAIAATKYGNAGAYGGMAGAGGETYPSPVTNGLLLSEMYIGEPTANVTRGKLPGICYPLHARPLSHLDTFTGTGDLSGKTYLVLNTTSASQAFLEISNTW